MLVKAQRLGGLQFEAAGWTVDHADAVRHGKVEAGVEAGAVEQQHGAIVGTGTDRLGESVEQAGERRLGYAVSEEIAAWSGQVPI